MRPQELLAGISLYAVLLAVALLYWQGLPGPWLLDDMSNLGALSLLDNPDLAWQEIFTNNRSGLLGRPVSMLSFIADYQAYGLSSEGFKYTNLLLHLLCTCLVFWLILELGRGLNDQHLPMAAALVATAFWAAAPLLVSTVLYVVQRMAQLACLFSLAGLLAYTIGRHKGARKKWTGRLLQVSSIAIWLPLAALSKENGLLLPALLLCIEFFIFRFRGDADERRWLITYFVITCGLPAITALIWLALHHQQIVSGYGVRDFSLAQRLLTEPRVLADYVQQFFVPHGGRMGLYQDDFPISTGLFKPLTTLYFIAALFLSVAICFTARSRAARALAFGWMFFLIGHLLESTIIALEIYFEHRNYLPSIGLAGGVALALDQALQKPGDRRGLLMAGVLLTATSAVASYQRTSTWGNFDVMLESALAYHPDSTRLQSDVAIRRAQHGDLQPALAALERSLALAPASQPVGMIGRLAVFCIAGAAPAPADYVYKSLPTDWLPQRSAIVFASSALGHLNLMLTRNACPALDRSQLIAGLNGLLASMPVSDMKGSTDSWTLFFEAARTAILANDPHAFILHLQTAMMLDPARPEAGTSLIVHYLNESNRELAIQTFNTMISTNPSPNPFLADELQRLKALLWPENN